MLEFVYCNNYGKDVYLLPSGKHKESNDEKLGYQKKLLKIFLLFSVLR